MTEGCTEFQCAQSKAVLSTQERLPVRELLVQWRCSHHSKQHPEWHCTAGPLHHASPAVERSKPYIKRCPRMSQQSRRLRLSASLVFTVRQLYCIHMSCPQAVQQGPSVSRVGSYLQKSLLRGVLHGQVVASSPHGPGWQGVVSIAADVAGLVRVVAHCIAVKGSLSSSVSVSS